MHRVVRTYEARSEAPPDAAWALLARPGLWSRWAPHVRGAWGLGDPEVELGRSGAARLLGAIPIPARVTQKEAGRSWTWKVGPVDFVHHVRSRSDGGCVVGIDLTAPAALEAALAVAYGPIVALTMRRLARAAERDTFATTR